MARNLLAAIAAATICMAAYSPAHAESSRTLQIAPGVNLNDVIRQAFHDQFENRGPVQAAKPDLSKAATSLSPTISGGVVKQGTLVVGQANSLPILEFTYDSKNAPLEGVEFTFTSPNGVDAYEYQYYPRTLGSGGTVVFEPDLHARYWAQPGEWQLTSVLIFDTQQNYTQYNQAQLAKLFPKPYITVVNKGAVDITPPVVTAGKILTPTVSLSSPVPVFRATLTGSDDVSGIGISFVVIKAPGSQFGQTILAPVQTPIKAGTVDAYAPIASGSPTGKWSITGYGLCDLAGNCFTYSSESDIKALFGTTSFTVTK